MRAAPETLDPPLKSMVARTRSPLVRAAQRLLLATSGTPLRRVWVLAHRAVAQLVAALLLRGEAGATAYARASFGGPEFLPGLSDIDLAFVLATDAAADRVRRRRTRHAQRLTAGGLVDTPFVFSQEELRAVAGRSVLTYPGAVFGGARARHDLHRMLQRPELDDPTLPWRRLRGPERRPPARPRDAQESRVAAWLELVFWWRWAFPACVVPSAPWLASRCVRLVAEPGRVWLALEHGERAATREEALRLLLRRLPEEEAALRATIALQRALPRSPEAPLAAALAVMLRLSERIAATLARQLADAPVREVALTGARTPPPLLDWRALVVPGAADERLLPLAGDPADPQAVGAAAVAGSSEAQQPVLRSGALLLLPGTEFRHTRLRAIQCALTDPVSFAVLAGERRARFPDVAGWSIHDAARRAVAEHAARLRAEPGDLGLLLSATRAALLHHSVLCGDPELVLAREDAVARLPGDAAAEALHHHRAGTAAPAAVRTALQRQVLALPAYALTPAP